MVHLLSSIGTLAITMVHNHHLLTHWLSLWYTTVFYWPNDPLCGTHPSSIGPLALPVFYRPTGSPYVRLLSSPGPVAQSYGTLPFSTGPLAVSVVHYYLLLAHWLSLWSLLSSSGPLALHIVHIIFYWPTAPTCLCGTQLSPTGPLAISMVHYNLLLAHCLSL